MAANNFTVRILLLLCALAVGMLGYHLLFERNTEVEQLHFLDVGQGDSELLELPGNISVLTDAGPDASVVARVDAILKKRRHIDLAIITHPQADHFNGFNYLLDSFSFGAILLNGRNDDPGVAEWQLFLKKASDKKIPIITVGRFDTIKIGKTLISIISPDPQDLQSAELNDTGIVERIATPHFAALLTADIGFSIEQKLINQENIRSDILKIGHHGSRYSSSPQFLSAVSPRISVIEVGKKNRYGHPASETVLRISKISKNLFRTDRDGTISVIPQGENLQVYASHMLE